MRLGQKLVIFGAFFGALCLSFGLYNMASALSDGEEVAADSKSRIDVIENRENIQQVEQHFYDCEVSGQYPGAVLNWCELITVEAQKHGLSPDLLAAVVLQESSLKETLENFLNVKILVVTEDIAMHIKKQDWFMEKFKGVLIEIPTKAGSTGSAMKEISKLFEDAIGVKLKEQSN